MLVGGVIDDEIDDEAHVALSDAIEEGVEVGHGAELLHHFAVVADVVTVVGIGGVEVRREPDDVDSEMLQVVEFGGDTGQVADAVAVGVFEGSWVDLVDDGFFPPLGFVAVDEFRLLLGGRSQGGERQKYGDDESFKGHRGEVYAGAGCGGEEEVLAVQHDGSFLGGAPPG
jgi:hypothetical protein